VEAEAAEVAEQRQCAAWPLFSGPFAMSPS